MKIELEITGASIVINDEDLPEKLKHTLLHRILAILVAQELKSASVKMSEVEKSHIIQMLEKNGNNRKKTAKMLGISYRTFFRKLNEYGIPTKHKGQGGLPF